MIIKNTENRVQFLFKLIQTEFTMQELENLYFLIDVELKERDEQVKTSKEDK